MTPTFAQSKLEAISPIYIIAFAVVSGVIVLAYLLTKARQATQAAGEAIANPIADVLVPIIVGESEVRVKGSIRLPDNRVIDINKIALQDDLTFTWQNIRYRLTRRGSDDIFLSVRI